MQRKQTVSGRLATDDLNTGSLLPTNNETGNPDLGFGAIVARTSGQRLLNRDGSFNVERRGLNFWSSLSLYHTLLTLSWGKFLGLLVVSYLAANLLFAVAYLAAGPGALAVTGGLAIANRFWQAFFFSVHTFATIGYGNITPVGMVANIIVTIESLTGLLGVTLATGLLFARFSRPTAKILFSERAVVAPFQEGEAFMFRITNARSNQLTDVSATVIFAQFEEVNGQPTRRFYPLPLELAKVTFFSLSWTIVHPINNESPLFGLSGEVLRARNAEFLILLSGIDETFSQTVHTRSSYQADEVVWGAKFANIFNPITKEGVVTIDVRRLSEIERV
ncbi:MAG: transporter [Acidobacteria bacterium]|nr:transporter [Acidobacteriota bacterium]MBI3427547.1 transporter [Acidobacteriota bacterium]